MWDHGDPFTLFSSVSMIYTYVSSILVFIIVKYLLNQEKLKVLMKNRGIYGIDINKTTPDERDQIKKALANGTQVPLKLQKYHIPESAGIYVGVVYLVFVTIVLGICSESPEIRVSVLAAEFSVLLILLLGFLDDVLELRWRTKVTISFIATIPLLAFYHGVTTVKVPTLVGALFRDIPGVDSFVLYDDLLDLGVFYLAYMALICVFCTNSINILAGVNGVECGQSLIIAIFMVIHNVYSMYLYGDSKESYLTSFVFLLPFITASAALMTVNWAPAQWFIGDSYTYFAGMVLASASIIGHFSKATLLLFIPQLINFTISIPQLIGIMECPKHRLPRYIPSKGILEPTRNLTVLNSLLYLFGNTTESGLSSRMLVSQVVLSTIGLALYHHAL